MFQTTISKMHDAIVAELDQNADGKFTTDDIKSAALKAEAKLKARQTNWFVGSLVGLAAFGCGFVTAIAFFCRH